LVACESNEKKAADFCSVVARVETALAPLVLQLNSGDFPVPDELKATLTNFRNQLSEMSSVAPAAIADDMILVVNGFTAFDLGLQQVDYDYNLLFSDDEAAAQAEADMAAMDAPETQDAMTAVDEFAFAECGISLNTSGE
jgi:hypothetical protein